MKTKRVKARDPLFSARNAAALVITLGLVFFAFSSLTRKIIDPDTVRLTKEGGDVSMGQVGPLRLMLSSHGRIMWYYPETDETKVLHEGQVRH